MEENENKSVYTKVPAKVSPWTSFKNFLFQDVVVELTPKQEKVFKEVREFWTQEIYFDKGFHLRKNRFSQADDELKEVNISL